MPSTTRIKDLTEASSPASTMNLVVDSDDGTKRLLLSTLIDSDLETAGKAADAKAVGDAISAEATARDNAIAANVDSTLSTTGKSADAKATGDALSEIDTSVSALNSTKADSTGSYNDLVSGNLTTTHGDTDQQPYRFRKVPYPTSREEVKKIVGGTVAWNQLVDETQFAIGTLAGITASLSNHKVKMSGTTTGGYNFVFFIATRLVKDHKYLAVGLVKNQGVTIAVYSGSAKTYVPVFSTNYGRNGNIIAVPTSADDYQLYANQGSAGVEVDVEITPQFIDLTTLFGSTIADYIYTLESGTAGAGIAKLKEWGFFSEPYYPYDPGSLKSVEGLTSHEMVGFNQWDEEWELGWINQSTGQNESNPSRIRAKNYTLVFPSTQYYVFCGANEESYIYQYDSGKNFLQVNLVRNNSATLNSNARYIRVAVAGQTTYNHDICINLSDPARNGTYEPYQKHSYPLDSDLTLRGVPKLDANNNLYFDGDWYEPSGTVTRRMIQKRFDGSSSTGWGKAANYGTVTRFDYSNSDVRPKLSGGDVVSNMFPVGAISTSGLECINVHSGNNLLQIQILTSKLATDDVTGLMGYFSSHPLDVAYVLTNPTTETADPFTPVQICDKDGTEEFVSTATIKVPVGTETFYPDDLKARIEGLPDNFSTLIAPVEVTYTATRNYTSGSLLIVNNVLYKTTAAIANNGAITPGTNCQATTLAEIIAAL